MRILSDKQIDVFLDAYNPAIREHDGRTFAIEVANAQAELTQSETLKAVGEWLVWAKNPVNVVLHGFTYIDGGFLNQAIKELSKGKKPEGMRSRYVRRSKRTSN